MATTITANGINFPDGSAGSPSIGGTDTNTGLFTGSDIVGFATGGSERLRIDASGNVNIANDSGKLQLGTSADLQIYHSGSHSHITDAGTGGLKIRGSQVIIDDAAGDVMIQADQDGSVDLYHDGSKTAWTHGSGFNIKGGNTSDQTELIITGNEGQAASILMSADDGDDNADHWRMYSNADNSFTLTNYTAGSYETNIKAVGDGAVELYHNNLRKFRTVSDGCEINATEGGDAVLALIADEGDDNADYWKIESNASTNNLNIANYSSGSWANKVSILSGGGLTFNGDTSADNALDDYEEGTYTPTFTSSGATFAYNHQYGYYQKVGNHVHVTFYITLSGTSSSGLSSNDIVINLPFAATGSTRFEAGVAFGMIYKIDLAGFGNPLGKVYQSNSYISMVYADDNNTGGAYGSDRFDESGCGISGSVTYKV